MQGIWGKLKGDKSMLPKQGSQSCVTDCPLLHTAFIFQILL